jgi:hypothetical protein
MANILNKLEREQDFNVSDFALLVNKSDVKSFNLDYLHRPKREVIYKQDLKDKEDKKNIINLSLNDIILEMNDIFFITLEMLSKRRNPLIFIFSTPKRQFCSSLLLLILGFLLLVLSNLMMEKYN